MAGGVAIVYTKKSIERILREGGASPLRLNLSHAQRCAYVVCTRNNRFKNAEGPEPHRSAFLVGRIAEIVPCQPAPGKKKGFEKRFLIRFSQFARIGIWNFWNYKCSLIYRPERELRIDFSSLDWEPMPEPQGAPPPALETP